MDFVLMQKLAAFADKTPSLKWMNLGPSMEQFSHTMTAQVRWVPVPVLQSKSTPGEVQTRTLSDALLLSVVGNVRRFVLQDIFMRPLLSPECSYRRRC